MEKIVFFQTLSHSNLFIHPTPKKKRTLDESNLLHVHANLFEAEQGEPCFMHSLLGV